MSVSCLSHIPEDMEAMNEVVSFMITHAKELFKVSLQHYSQRWNTIKF